MEEAAGFAESKDVIPALKHVVAAIGRPAAAALIRGSVPTRQQLMQIGTIRVYLP